MTCEEAKRILHPDTTLEALTEIEYYAGFRGEQAKREAVDEACIVACEALEKRIPKKPINQKDGFGSHRYNCPNCFGYLVSEIGRELCVGAKLKYCHRCGQALDWSE